MIGGSLVLNLGALQAGGGGVLSINLGINWFDTPVEPGDGRLVQRGIGVRWGRAAKSRAIGRIGWVYAPAVCQQASPNWGHASAIEKGLSLHWSLSPLLKHLGDLTWSSRMPSALRADHISWGNIGRASAGLRAPWFGELDEARKLGRVPWSSGAALSPRYLLPWHVGSEARHARLAIRWAYPALARQYRLMPWGWARPIPWQVRPPEIPGPDPDPGPVFPEGGRVALHLGCALLPTPGLAPLNLGVAACYAVRHQQRTYIVINSISVVRLPDRIPIEVSSVTISSSCDTWGSTFDFELADVAQLPLLKPSAAGPRQVEVTLNGYTWTALIESYSSRREWGNSGISLLGRSRTALLAAPYAPVRAKVATEDRTVAQLVDEELADTGFTASYDTVDWVVPAGAWFYDATPPLDAVSRLAEASGGVVQSHPADPTLRVRARYPHSPWEWRDRTPEHVVQEDIVLNENLQVRSAPFYDAVVVTGELAGKGVTCKVRRAGEAGQLFAPQVSSPLINTSGVAAERGRNILADRGEQAAIDLVLPLFTGPLRPGEVGRILPLDLVEVVGEGGTWHGLCTAVRTEARIGDKAAVIEQTITLERHYTDAD